MKAKSTIRKQIARLKKVCKETNDSCLYGETYEAWQTLRWVLKDSDWNPAEYAEKRLEDLK